MHNSQQYQNLASFLNESASDIEENYFVTEFEEVDDIIRENEYIESNSKDSDGIDNVECDGPTYKVKRWHFVV